MSVQTSKQVAALLTLAQCRELGNAIRQDPTGALTDVSKGRVRRLPIKCDLRIAGSLVGLGCLAHAEGWDDMFTVTPLGRAVYKC